MMTLITGFTCPPTIYFKFITKCDSFFYYKVRWSVITKCDKCYYKVRQVLQSVTILLQSATGITKCDDYYKVRQYGRRTSKPRDDLTERFDKTTAQECKKTSSARLTCVEQTNTTASTRTGKFYHFSCPLQYHVTLLLSHRF